MALIEYDEYKQKLKDMGPELDKLSAALDLEGARAEVRQLEAESAQDGFWNDLERSQRVHQRLKHSGKLLHAFCGGVVRPDHGRRVPFLRKIHAQVFHKCLALRLCMARPKGVIGLFQLIRFFHANAFPFSGGPPST